MIFGYLRRDHRSVYYADLKPVCDPRPACDVFPAGGCRAFLDAQIWSGGDSGFIGIKMLIVDFTISDRRLAGRGVWHSGDDVYFNAWVNYRHDKQR